VVIKFIAYSLTGDRRTPRRQSKTTDFGGSQPNDLFEIFHNHLCYLPFRLKRDESITNFSEVSRIDHQRLHIILRGVLILPPFPPEI
jgi:hypothetical protein